MRTYGRQPVDPKDPSGPKKWVEINTDTNGFNDLVYLVTLQQVLLLNYGESPFWANYGIPARESIMQQIFPDFYMVQTQRQFAGYFGTLIIAREDLPTPVYNIAITTHTGAKINTYVPVPQ